MSDVSREIYGLRFSLYDAGKSSQTGKQYQAGQKLSANGQYLNLSALQIAALFQLATDPEVRKELGARVKVEKEQLGKIQVE